jgi:hypothetical protein
MEISLSSSFQSYVHMCVCVWWVSISKMGCNAWKKGGNKMGATGKISLMVYKAYIVCCTLIFSNYAGDSLDGIIFPL